MNTKQHEKIVYKELSYIIQGCCFEIRKEYGPGQKESVYVNLLKECLEDKGILIEKEKSIKIYSSKSGKVVGTYKPDLVVDNKIPIEIKSSRITIKQDEKQLYHYLRNSKYELGYLINFSTSRLYIKRIVYSNYKKPFLKILSCIFVFLFAWFSVAQGAILYLEPSSAEYHQDDTFLVEVRIETENECINAVAGDLFFSQHLLEAIDFSRGNSILTLWPKLPVIDQKSGLISFSGGLPGGFCGFLPGEPGKPNLLGKIVFKTKKTETALLGKVGFLDTSQVLLNDGLGTPAKLTFKEADFTILPAKREIIKEEWQVNLIEDNFPPEPFTVEVHQDPLIFEGKYFIIFSTTDKQTGLDYYEVKEGKGSWQRAESPYLLKDQSLKNKILVKAVDKAGNERIVEHYTPSKQPIFFWLILIILAGFGVSWWLIIKLRPKQKKLL